MDLVGKSLEEIYRQEGLICVICKKPYSWPITCPYSSKDPFTACESCYCLNRGTARRCIDIMERMDNLKICHDNPELLNSLVEFDKKNEPTLKELNDKLDEAKRFREKKDLEAKLAIEEEEKVELEISNLQKKLNQKKDDMIDEFSKSKGQKTNWVNFFNLIK